MGRYRLAFRKSVARDLRTIPNKDVARILAQFDSLSKNPRGPGCEKLSGQERYRARRGADRILYEIQDDEAVVLIVKVGHRRHVYRGG